MSHTIAALRALEQHLVEQSEHGVERAYLSPQALADLNSLPAAVAAATPKAPPAAAAEKDAPPPPAVAAAPEPAKPPQGLDEKRARLREIALRAKACPKTKALDTLRDQFVFATGNADADLMFVGEAPGMEEEKKHRPFVGPAGQLLDKIVSAMGLDREQVYISNIVKFRPSTGSPNQGSANRKPDTEEMATSVGYVLEEIDVVQPKVIVALGGTAMEGLLGLEGGVGRNRSRFHTLREIPVMVTYHPSYLLRSQGLREKRKVWEDMLIVMERLQLPVSAKQQDYFL